MVRSTLPTPLTTTRLPWVRHPSRSLDPVPTARPLRSGQLTYPERGCVSWRHKGRVVADLPPIGPPGSGRAPHALLMDRSYRYHSL